MENTDVTKLDKDGIVRENGEGEVVAVREVEDGKGFIDKVEVR